MATNNEWLLGLKEKLRDYDIATLIDILVLDTDDIVDRCIDIIEDNAEQIAENIGYGE